MRAATFFNFFAFLLFSLFFVASALPEPPNEFGLSARALDEFNNPPDPASVAGLPESQDIASPDAGQGGHGGGGCSSGWGKCSNWGYCCPWGGQCCGGQKCCKKGYYCYKDKWHNVQCCRSGYNCQKGGGGHQWH